MTLQNVELDSKSASSEALESPVFVVGPLRSGTTMLRLIMSRHSRMHFFGEFEGAVSQAVGDTWPSLESYHRFVQIDRQTSNYQFHVDPSLGYEALVKSFLAQMHERDPQPIIGASVHSRIDLLPKLWPNARFIHLLRDPRDVARSCIGMGWVGNVHEGAQYWINAEQCWDRAVTQIRPDQWIEVRYEELVTEPEKETARLCAFLGLEFEDAMLDLEQSSTYSRPSGKYANQWRTKLSSRERLWVEYQARELMTQRDYPITIADKQSLSAWDKCSLKLHSRLGRIRFNIAQWGFWNWFGYVSSKVVRIPAYQTTMQKRINRIRAAHLK